MYDFNKIQEFAAEIDGYLKKLESFAGVMRECKSSLEIILHSKEATLMYEVQKLKQEVANLSRQLQKHGLPETSKYESELQEIKTAIENPKWPEAVEQANICVTPERAVMRAESILDMFVAEQLKGRRFLDYGCGQGLTVPAALQREASFALGYDIDPSKSQIDEKLFTSSFDKVRANAPYDIILMHDVLDHITAIDPVEALRQASSLLRKGGRLFVWNHPWSSRHGGHLYLQKNKAFLHLLMDEVELSRTNGITSEHNIKVITPLETYRHWFEVAELQIVSELPIRDAIEPFFLEPSQVNDRLQKIWPTVPAMIQNMEISVVEYVLQPKPSHQQMF